MRKHVRAFLNHLYWKYKKQKNKNKNKKQNEGIGRDSFIYNKTSFELIGLCLADGNYDKSEKEFINNLCSELNVENVYSDKCEEYVRDYLKLQLKINELVIG